MCEVAFDSMSSSLARIGGASATPWRIAELADVDARL
jgi:hypothetical protein